MTAKTRTFIAFETPLSVRQKIIPLQTELQRSHADVRWESPDKFHITIKFLGEVDDRRLPEIIALVGSVVQSHTCFNVVYAGLGAFPDTRHPKVVWIGCENPDGTLIRLKDDLDRELATKGFEIERRAFHPHLTLGRVKGPEGMSHLTPMIENLTFEPQSIQINEIVVMKSRLQPQGSVYRVMKNIQLQ